MKQAPTSEFLFDYGALPLSLVATIRHRGNEDLLAPAGAPGRWLHEAGLTATTVPVSTTHVQALMTLRRVIQEIAEALISGAPVPPLAVASLNAQAAMPLAIPQLDAAGMCVMTIAPDPVAAALASIARAAVELFGGPDAGRIKECEMEDCRALFLDTSRGRGRRWCSMERCGARAKAKAFRARRLASKSPEA